MADINLQDVHDTMLSVAFEAGRMILAANPSDMATGIKMNCGCLRFLCYGLGGARR